MLSPRVTHAHEAIRTSRAPLGVATRIVAIDGLGGSGKSSLAATLSGALNAPVVATDDFASWEDPVDWWPELVGKVLEPLASGLPVRYTPTTWGGPEKDERVLVHGNLVLLEGVGASRRAFQRYLAYSIWVETPRDVRLRRGLERDGEDALPNWQQWMALEDAYVERERPAERADLVLPGDAGLWS